MLKPSYAYLDTTPADFKKPEIIKVKPYKYRESKVRLHTEKAVGKLVPMMMGGIVTGPVRFIELGNKAMDYSHNSKY